MERIKKGAELAAWRHGFQAGELTIASLCPYSTGSILAKAWHEGYQKARDEQGLRAPSKPPANDDET